MRQALSDSYDAIDLSAFSVSERSIVACLLRQAITDALPFNGEYKADWLLEGGLGDARWKTLDGSKTRLIDGIYERTMDVIFDINLPDGSRLLDNENVILLGAVQKSAFLLRCGLLDASPGPQSWANSVCWLLNFSCWIMLHKSRLKPKEYGFSLFDQNSLNLLLQQLSVNGWVEALNVIPQILSHLYKSATGNETPQEYIDEPFKLPFEVCATLTDFLKKNSMYDKRNSTAVCRSTIAGIVDLKPCSLNTKKTNAFLRQFEPSPRNSNLLIGAHIRTEHPTQNTVLISKTMANTPKENSFEGHSSQLKRFLPAYRHLPTLFPDPRLVDVQQANDLSKHQTSQSGHHNLIPLNTGLAYLNESMRWVIVYGDAIINGVLEMTKAIHNINSSDSTKKIKIAEKHKIFAIISKKLKTTALPDAPSRPLSEVIHLSCYLRSTPEKSFDLMRNAPSLMDALEILVGACLVSIAILKPSRDEEIWSLKRSCTIKHQSGRGDAWWLEFSLGKSGQLGVNRETQKPIPYFTAKAIGLIQRLGDGLCKIYSDDNTCSKDLFYLPTKSFGIPTDNNTRTRVNTCLNHFCDYVNLPTDQYGRRWYVRIHEMRKWFLLMMFWHSRYGVLDAVRWIAGHTNAKHTYAYIEANFPGEELPKLEAQYVDEKLIMLERGNVREGEHNLVALYDNVCKHFGVTKIEGIRRADYMAYLKDLREENIYHIELYSIFSHSGQEIIGIDVAVKFTEKS